MKFTIHGPFDVPRVGHLIDDSAKSKTAFWLSCDLHVPEISSACGCYVFVIRKNKNARPWYIGLTTKKTFKGEVFGLHKINHYNHAMAAVAIGKPQLYFLAKRTPGGKFQKPSANSLPAVEFLETFLFGVALNQNSALRNSSNTKFLRNVVVPGVLNTPPGAPKAAEKALRADLGL